MRLLIVDDHEVVRRGIRSLLSDQAGCEVCGEAVDGQDALDKARELKPDLIVMDVSMPRLNGLDATRQVRSMLPDCEVLMLSQHENGEMARQALKAGARGYIVKTSISEDLISALAKVSRREYFFDPAILNQTPLAHTDVHEILQRSAAFEKALRANEEHLQLVTRSMAVAVTRCSSDFRYLWANQACADLIQEPLEKIVGKKIVDVLGKDVFYKLLPNFERVLSGERVSYEEEIDYSRAGAKCVLATYTPTRDATGKVDGWVAVVADITDRKNNERALANAARQQKALFHFADELQRAASLDEVHRAALNAILDALQCNRASILLCGDAGIMRFKSWRGLSSEYRAATEGHSAWRPDERNPQPVRINDVNSADLGESLKTVIRKEGISALAFIPLISKGKLVGKFMAYFNAPHTITEDEIALSLTIARQLAFAIERMLGTDALQQSERQLTRESEALRNLNDSASRLWQMRSLQEGLEEMLSATIELLGADKGNVQILDTERRVLTIEAQHGFQKNFLDFFREVSASDDCACGRALRSGERIVIFDVDQNADFAPYRDVARAADFRAVISTPLVGKNGTGLGMLSTHFRSPHQPSDQELRRLDLYVRQASDFIERCNVDEELRQTEERLRTLSASLDSEVRARTKELENKNANLLMQSERLRGLSRALFHAQDEERRRIARELHDSAGQLLAALGIGLDQAVREAKHAAPPVAKRLEEVQSMVQQLNREIRTTSYLLHPPLLDESGLSSALRLYAEGLNGRSEIVLTLEIPEDFGRLPNEIELAIFRVVQECVTNIHRHSGSKTAFVRVSRNPEGVRVEVKDEGRGMSPERLAEIQSGVSGVGFRGMQERLRSFDGVVTIESDGSGTCVIANIPVPSEVRFAKVARVQTAM
jgi:PAS domain S-box-containing protein